MKTALYFIESMRRNKKFDKILEDIIVSNMPLYKKRGWMIDPADTARLEIVDNAKQLEINDPVNPSKNLGEVTLDNGQKVNSFVIHAVDAIITNGKSVVMINRKFEPGKGKPALPGGFMDPGEINVQSAIREAEEEAGIKLSSSQVVAKGNRNYDRPYDIRIAKGKGLLDKYGVGNGDAFIVSTQWILFKVDDLENKNLIAGDDAQPGSVRLVPIKNINRSYVGIPDHADMVQEATKNITKIM